MNKPAMIRAFAKKAIEDILGDLEVIENEAISKRDYKTALRQFKYSLLKRGYCPVKREIGFLHCGNSFIISVEGLIDALEQKDDLSYYIKAYGIQTKLSSRD